jgi:cell division protein FtsL
MRKVTLTLQMRLVMSVDEGVDISQVIDELDYTISDTTTTADILDTEIADYEIIDSK